MKSEIQGKEKSGSAQGAGAHAPKTSALHPLFTALLDPFTPCQPGDAPQPYNHTPSAHTPNYEERD